MKISAIVVTARLGGFDMLVGSFSRQTMPREDWELIVVDDYHEERKGLLDGSGLPVRHVLPDRRKETYDNTAALNCGVREAKGELLTFLVDYTWVDPDYLATHWHWYQTLRGYSMTSYVDRYPLPAIRTEGDLRYSSFVEPFDESYFAVTKPDYMERKGGHLGAEILPGVHEMPGCVVYMLGDSIPMTVMRELNGWDEIYDLAYGVNDVDLCVRANIIGWRWALNPASVVRKLGTLQTSVGIPGKRKPRLGTTEENYRVFEKRIRDIVAGRESARVPKGRGAWE